MTLFDLLIRALACWYVAHAVTSTHGPFGIFHTLRTGLPLGGLTSCPVCLAFWVGLLLLLVPDGVVLHALAVAGAAMLLHGYTGWRFGG